jgi:HlyD family secretion protein
VSESNTLRRRSTIRRIAWSAIALLAIAAAAWLLRPKPVPVDTAAAANGPMEVTVDEEGEVRVHDRYVIAAPVTGKLVRVRWRDGDTVRTGDVVAELEPAPLDPRSRDEALARVAAARALVRAAEQEVQHATAELSQARREQARMEQLAADRFISEDAVDKARTIATTAAAAQAAAHARESAARSELRAVEATLLGLPGGVRRIVPLKTPVAGRILRITEQSEHTVGAGTPIMTIGDPTRFEIVADVLSTDAVRIRPGARARLEGWGGDRSLSAEVRLVEPYAFTKISALGIEEQRVNIVMDPLESLDTLGDGYKVDVRVVVWAAEAVLKVPASAVFRRGDAWGLFRVDAGRARFVAVEVGQRNAREAQILKGIEPGATVVRYPSNELRDGARVRPRQAAIR